MGLEILNTKKITTGESLVTEYRQLSASELFELVRYLPEEAKPKYLEYSMTQNCWRSLDGSPVSDILATDAHTSSALNWLIQYCGLSELIFELWSYDAKPGIVCKMRSLLDGAYLSCGDGVGPPIVCMVNFIHNWLKNEHLRS